MLRAIAWSDCSELSLGAIAKWWIWKSCPFGGVKESGFGKDLGREALNEYMKTKTITMEYSI